jgi:hypothetical protein
MAARGMKSERVVLSKGLKDGYRPIVKNAGLEESLDTRCALLGKSEGQFH